MYKYTNQFVSRVLAIRVYIVRFQSIGSDEFRNQKIESSRRSNLVENRKSKVESEVEHNGLPLPPPWSRAPAVTVSLGHVESIL